MSVRCWFILGYQVGPRRMRHTDASLVAEATNVLYIWKSGSQGYFLLPYTLGPQSLQYPPRSRPTLDALGLRNTCSDF